MKKLLLVYIVFSALPLNAQNRQTLSIAFGPNGFYQYWEAISANTTYGSRLGWSAGAEVGFAIADAWDLKVGFRYQELNSVAKSGNLMWPSEYLTGTYVYDPSLPHTVDIELRDVAWQYMMGPRYYLGQPKTWRCYVDAEVGITYHNSRPKQGKSAARLLGGVGFGLQWLPPARQVGFFAQPMLRYMVSNRKAPIGKYSAAIPSLEVGIRAQLSTRTQ